jgi:hypothetical protein
MIKINVTGDLKALTEELGFELFRILSSKDYNVELTGVDFDQKRSLLEGFSLGRDVKNTLIEIDSGMGGNIRGNSKSLDDQLLEHNADKR